MQKMTHTQKNDVIFLFGIDDICFWVYNSIIQ